MSRHQLSRSGTRVGQGAGMGLVPDATGPSPSAPAWLPEHAPQTLLVTGLEVLRGEVERVVAAAGGQLRTVGDLRAAAPFWDSSTEVLLGSDIGELPPRGRSPAVLVGLHGDGDGLWHLAAAAGADRVAVLPDAAAWLAEYLSRSRRPEPGGFVLGIVGGCGGAGASTAAVWLGHAAAHRNVNVLLVDGDPRGGGLELLIDAEEAPGLRWPDLADARGTIDPHQFADSLPAANGVPFLSWPGTREPGSGVDHSVVAGVLEAARRRFELVVMDLGRSPESLRQFAGDCDRIIVVVPALLRAAVAASRVLGDLPTVETVLAVRGSSGATLHADLIAESVGLPLAGVLPEIRSATGATERGRLLDAGRQRRVRRFTSTVLDFGAGGTR